MKFSALFLIAINGSGGHCNLPDLLYHNAYSREKLEKFVSSHPRVKDYSWEPISAE